LITAAADDREIVSSNDVNRLISVDDNDDTLAFNDVTAFNNAFEMLDDDGSFSRTGTSTFDDERATIDDDAVGGYFAFSCFCIRT
jgi:hypothetical protein